MKIVVQLEVFDPGEELDNFKGQLKSSGALVSFSGIVRDIPGGLARIEIEHYPIMTEKAINKICSEACLRWELEDIMVIHRFGSLKKGELITAVNNEEFTISELLTSAKRIQESVNANQSKGIGIYRIGIQNQLPSYYIGEYIDLAGILK